jgi:hypothetical protein
MVSVNSKNGFQLRSVVCTAICKLSFDCARFQFSSHGETGAHNSDSLLYFLFLPCLLSVL